MSLQLEQYAEQVGIEPGTLRKLLCEKGIRWSQMTEDEFERVEVIIEKFQEKRLRREILSSAQRQRNVGLE